MTPQPVLPGTTYEQVAVALAGLSGESETLVVGVY